MIEGLLWTEKYRPRTLDDMALDGEVRTLLTEYVEQGEFPHLLFIGPPGSGKTTIGRILIRSVDCAHITLNASSERGIDVVRDKIGSFVQTMTAHRWNVVFLDELDAMTADAQTALRNLIEAYEHARFVGTANFGHKVIGPIQSRCQVVPIGRPPLPQRTKVLLSVLKAEGVTCEPTVAISYAERHPDMRDMLMSAQRAAISSGGAGPLAPATAVDRATGARVLEMIDAKDWRGLRNVAATCEDHAIALRDLFWAIPDEHPRVGKLRHIVGRGVHETGFTPDPVVLFLAVCAEAMA